MSPQRGRRRGCRPSTTTRFWEIDCARTVAILMMVTYHVVYDVDFLAPGLGPDPLRGAWGVVPEATASLFLLIAGVGFSISDARGRAGGLPGARRLAGHARRALLVLGAGMVVTVATLAVIPGRFVRFGILHSIGTALLIAPAFARLGRWCAPVGVAVIVAGIALSPLRSDVPGLLVFGVQPAEFRTVDYWPVLPWFGVFALGMALGRALYPGGSRGAFVDGMARRVPSPGMTHRLGAPGRRSLLIYLVHQPVLIAIIAAVLTITGQSVEWGW